MLRHLCTTVCLTATLAVVGCGFQSDEPAGEGDGGTFRFLTADPIKTIDPQGTSWLVDFRVIRCLFEPLLRTNAETFELEPAVAGAMPEVSEDGLVYTYRLREDAKWSNGDPVTAGDFVYGWKRAIYPDFAADYSGLFFCVEGVEEFFAWRSAQLDGFEGRGLTARELWEEAEAHFAQTVGIKALDDRTLQVTLDQPTAYFNDLAAFPTFSPIHEASASVFVSLDPKTGSATSRPEYFRDTEKLVTNGPYVMTQWEFRQRMILDQSPQYWDRANMGNTRLVMLVVEDSSNAMIKYRNGEADWYAAVDATTPNGAALLNSGRSDVHRVDAAGTYFYRFNCRPTIDGQPNPLADIKLRRAFSMAVDRQELVDRVTQVGQPVARSFVPPGAIAGYEPPVEVGITFDPAGARKLLAEAGYPNGQGLSGLSILYNSNAGHEVPAQAIARMWREHLGVNVQLESLERGTFSERTRNGGYTIARASWYGDYRDPTTFLDMFRTTDGNNDSRYINPAFDALLVQATRTIDPKERMELLQQAEHMLLDDQPLMPLYHYVTLQLFDPAKVKGLYPNAWNATRLDRVSVLSDETTGE